MLSDLSKRLRIFHVLEGLSDGLSRFCGPTRVAFIFAEKFDDSLSIYDPYRLLEGHEYRLKELYIDSQEWRSCPLELNNMKLFGEMVPEKDLGLSGIISYGGRTANIFYQMWFAEHHPDVASTGPIERWMENAVSLLSHDFATVDDFYTASSRLILKEYASYAVRDYIMDELNLLIGWDMPYLVSTVLETFLEISRTLEEGDLPQGKLAILEPRAIKETEFLIKFPSFERPSLENYKHVRKLLTAVKESNNFLVSDGKYIIGISRGNLKEPSITADFRKSYGILFINKKPVCSFSEGRFYATNRRPYLVEFEEMLLESDLETDTRDDLLSLVTHLVQKAIDNQHGAAIIVDLNVPALTISGQLLEEPVSLNNKDNLELACSLSKLDGALHIGRDLKLYAFSCLMDGPAIENEDRSRGARFNSAIRFTHHRQNVIVITVSSDRPVSIFQDGVELTKYMKPNLALSIFQASPTLEQWLGL